MAPLIRRRGTRSIETDPCLWTGDERGRRNRNHLYPGLRAAHARGARHRHNDPPVISRVFKPRAPCTYALGPSPEAARRAGNNRSLPRTMAYAKWQRNKRTAFSRPGPVRGCALRPSDPAVSHIIPPRRQRKSHDESYSKLRY
jgi:hypothetical protein